MAEAEDHKESLQQEANPQITDAKEEQVSISENKNESQREEVNPQIADAKEDQISTSESMQREASPQFTDANEEPVSISEEGEATGLEKHNEEQSSEAADRLKELEGQLHGMKIELEGLASKKSELELQVESQETEARELRDENSKLSTRVLEEQSSEAADRIKELEGQLHGMNIELEGLASKKSELELQVESQETEARELRDENSKLSTRVLEEQSSEAADRIKELEGQLHGMKIELEGLASKKSELELQVESQETETQELRDENSKLSTRVLELEEMAENSRLEAAELDLQQELVSIQVQNSYLEQSMECMRNEASNQVKDLTDRVNVMKHELGNAQHTVAQKVPENLFETGTPRVIVAKRMLVEKEELEVKVSGLEVGADTSLSQRNELEQQVKSKVHETIQLKDEKEELRARIFELEGIVTEREKDLFDQQNKAESEEETEASQIKNKTSDQPINSKGSNEPTKSQSVRSMISRNISMFNKFSDPAKTVKPANESNDKMPSSRSMLNINTAKTNKNAKESVDSPRKMKRDQSMKRRMDDLAAEFRSTIEDKVRLLSQRIRVLEQLNAENNSTHKLLQQENKLLLEKVAHNETQFKKLKDLDKIAKTTMKRMEFMASKLDAGNKDLDRLANMFNELQLAKNWIHKRYESIIRLGYTLDSLKAELDSLKAELEEKQENIQKLEGKVEEIEEEVVYLGEKKREVIRQLCIVIDHLKEENEHLKEIVSKLTPKRSQPKR